MTTIPRGNELTRADLEAMPGYGVKFELMNGAIFMTPHGDKLTRRHLDAMPDDGRRYELLDGTIVVTAAPSDRHQSVVGKLHVLLMRQCPPDARVRVAPYDVTLDEFVTLQPDVVVARRKDIVPSGLPTAPLLAVEVLSPSTRLQDLGLKRDLLLKAGCPSYWVIDPGGDTTPPSLIAWELQDGAYVEIARVSGDESWTATRPFPVTVVPNDLLDE